MNEVHVTYREASLMLLGCLVAFIAAAMGMWVPAVAGLAVMLLGVWLVRRELGEAMSELKQCVGAVVQWTIGLVK